MAARGLRADVPAHRRRLHRRRRPRRGSVRPRPVRQLLRRPLPRLQAIKRKYAPDNIFHNAMSIPPR
ncbi:BBE domain-containing protein [Nocardia transvalensis]|uniref:BBE domain-containing protein n=1 Tax=Nocardia transvalensis TaxID=37333 RepID=UPI003A5D0B3F